MKFRSILREVTISAFFAAWGVSDVFAADKPLTVYFSGKKTTLDKVSEEMAVSLLEVIQRYEEYAKAQDLVAMCENELPVVFLTGRSPNQTKKLQEKVSKLIESFETSLGEKKDLDPFPIFVLPKTSQYGPLIDLIVKDHPYLNAWSSSARSLSGFQLFDPPVCVVLDDGVGQEEYNVENQTLHQLGHLLAGLHYGTLPFWLSEGIAWYFEEEAQKTIYGFCYRSGFVWASEHTGWLKNLNQRVRKEKDPKLKMAIGAPKESFDQEVSLSAFGVVFYLIQEKPEALKKFMKTYAAEHREKFGQEPTNELSAARQSEIMTEIVGEDFPEELRKYFGRNVPKRKK